MKALIAVFTSLSLILAAPLTWAGDGHRGGGYRGGHGHYDGHRYGHGHGHYRPYYYGHHHNNGDDEVAYLLGGLLLGGLVTHAYYNSQPRAVAAPPAQYAPAPAYTSYPQGRRLVRDAGGNCYESYFDAAGAEIRVPISPSECNW